MSNDGIECYGGGQCAWFGFKDDGKKEKSDIDLSTIDYTKLERIYTRNEPWLKRAKFVKV